MEMSKVRTLGLEAVNITNIIEGIILPNTGHQNSITKQLNLMQKISSISFFIV